MGLTERHWFENEDVPENYEWALEDAVYNSRTSKKLEEQVKEAVERCKGRKCEGCPFNGVPTRCVAVLQHTLKKQEKKDITIATSAEGR